ncbi:major head protein [Vibrio phage vB_VpaM_sm033]|nr:major head protein [Vibrio phage vB_VpaM_sm033]
MFNSFLEAGYNKSEFDKVQAKIELGIRDRAAELTPEAAELLANFNGDWDKLSEADATTLSGAVTAAKEVLNEAGYDEFLAKILVGAADAEKVEKFVAEAGHPGFQAGLVAAASMVIAEGKPEAYASAYVNPNGQTDQSTEIVGSLSGYDLEGFDNFVFDKFSVKSAMTAGIVAATSPFSQTFFRPSVLPASQNGLDLRVTVPYTYRRTYRPGTGAENKMGRKYLVRAPLDHTIMEDNSTDVIPVADANRAPVLQAAVATKQVEQHGITFDTRPLKYGTKVDLIDVSSNSELIRLGDMTEQDTLDPLVTIGRQVLKLTDGTNDSFVEVDLSTHIGAMLNYVAEGFEKSSSTQQEFTFWIHGTDEDYAGTPVDAAIDASGNATVAVITDANWRIKVTARISASIDEDANMVVDLAEISVDSLQYGADFGTLATSAELDTFTGAFDFVIAESGYFPDARRSNSNMRDVGTIVDAGRTTKYRLTAPLGAPISTVKPLVAMGNGVSIDGLSSAARLRDLGTSVTTLLDFEKKLIMTKDLPGNAAAIGGQLVTSTHKTASVNVTTMVRNRDSRHGLEDLRSHLVNAITMLSNFMIVDSGYLPALEMYTGSRSNFEVIVVTDPIIANHLMTSGDGRTLGNNRRFKVSEVDDERMRGKIYISLARTDTTGADVMSFGTQIVCAPFVHQAQVTLGASTHQMTQIIPRTAFHVTLPILGRIDVTGLEGFYLQTTP